MGCPYLFWRVVMYRCLWRASIREAQRRFPPQVPQNLTSSVVPRNSRDAATRVHRASAQVQALDGGSVVGKMRHGPLEEQLIQGQLALENMPLRQADKRLDVRGDEKLIGKHIIGETRREALHRLQHDLLESGFLPAPVRVLQLVGGVAAE